ncbi:MAG: hypothetical protein JJU05_08215 [Verrucomicrobia bacterium]|nr:hypothetical protein [Verrucomicrobiota bacterium]MCH8526728.1 hypothetical protein [Kiritimatiellia bacterium]
MNTRFTILLLALASFFVTARAQHLPIYYGHSEISGAGNFHGGRSEFSFRYGRYIENLVQMGFYADYLDSSFYSRTAMGALFIRSFDTPSYLIPYVGAGLGYGQFERGDIDASGIELSFLLGLRYFMTNNVSLNGEFHVGVSSDDTFLDGSDLDSIGMGFRFGLGYSW